MSIWPCKTCKELVPVDWLLKMGGYCSKCAPGLIKYDDLRSANLARQEEWCKGKKVTLSYRGNEMAGEAGEVCNVIKKLEREEMGLVGSRASIQNLKDELADVYICLDLIAAQANIDLNKAVISKFNETSEKYGLKTRLVSKENQNAS